MVSRFFSALWGKFESKQEVQKFSFLATILCIIIAVYWAMRPIKDSVFGAMVGVDYLPWAKIVSLCIVIPLVIVYSKLIDWFPRHRVFYLLTGIYGLLLLVFSYFFNHPLYGLPNTQEDPTRILGWLWYAFAESYGSMIIALFWAIATDTTKPEAAKRGFPFIYLIAQTGNIFGPYFLTAKKLGFSSSAPILAICGFITFVAGFLLMIFMKVTPKEQLIGYESEVKIEEKKTKAGFFEGLKLLFSKGYLLGIFSIIFIFETILPIFDFFFKASVKAAYPIEIENAAYLSQYAVWTGIVSFLCLLFGVNNIQRYFGITWSLLLTPILVAVAVTVIWSAPFLGVAFWIMVSAKAISYALNGPTIKQLYVPTSKEAKYKSQAWIEVFGSRAAKTAGSGINISRGLLKAHFGSQAGTTLFLMMSSLIAYGLIGVWFFAAIFVAKKYNEAIAEKKVVC